MYKMFCHISSPAPAVNIKTNVDDEFISCIKYVDKKPTAMNELIQRARKLFQCLVASSMIPHRHVSCLQFVSAILAFPLRLYRIFQNHC